MPSKFPKLSCARLLEQLAGTSTSLDSSGHLFFGCHGEVTTHEGMGTLLASGSVRYSINCSARSHAPGDFAERLTVEYVQNMWKRLGPECVLRHCHVSNRSSAAGKKVVTDVYKSSLLTEASGTACRLVDKMSCLQPCQKAPEDSPYTELKNIATI